MKKLLTIMICSLVPFAKAQSNTAVTSGSVGKCEVWDYPYTLYNNSGATQTVGSGVTVTIDQNRNAGAIILSGNGAMNLSGSNGIAMSGSGTDINCRWDISKNENHTVINNDNNPDTINHFQNWGTFFTAPYSGNYIWLRSSGWAASMSGGVKNGGIRVIKNNAKSTSYSIFYQNESGTCPASGTIQSPGWGDYLMFAMTPGETFQYGGSTKYSNDPSCASSVLNVTLGNAVVLYDN